MKMILKIRRMISIDEKPVRAALNADRVRKRYSGGDRERVLPREKTAGERNFNTELGNGYEYGGRLANRSRRPRGLSFRPT